MMAPTPGRPAKPGNAAPSGPRRALDRGRLAVRRARTEAVAAPLAEVRHHRIPAVRQSMRQHPSRFLRSPDDAA